MRRADLLRSHGFKYFDTVPSGYPYAGCKRYKKLLTTEHIPFMAAVIGPTWVLMSYCGADGSQHEKLVYDDNAIEDFINEHDLHLPRG